MVQFCDLTVVLRNKLVCTPHYLQAAFALFPTFLPVCLAFEDQADHAVGEGLAGLVGHNDHAG